MSWQEGLNCTLWKEGVTEKHSDSSNVSEFVDSRGKQILSALCSKAFNKCLLRRLHVLATVGTASVVGPTALL